VYALNDVVMIYIIWGYTRFGDIYVVWLRIAILALLGMFGVGFDG
jgi:hypothetical protein